VEVHVIIDLYTPCATPSQTALASELTAGLLYVSPTQINFMIPDVSPALYGQSVLDVRVVILRNGTRFDGLGTNSNNSFYGNGIFVMDPAAGFSIFTVGYDCLFFDSLSHPEACGLSWLQGRYRSALAAITDQTGNLISSQNPLHQGEVITIWSTGLGGLTLDLSNDLLRQANPAKLTVNYRSAPGTPTYAPSLTQTPLWAGESPQFMGLDQINLIFPICTTLPAGSTAPIPLANTEKRYSVYMTQSVLMIGGSSLTQTSVVVFDVPFLVRMGDPECPAPPTN